MLDEQSTGTTAERSADSAPRSRRAAAQAAPATPVAPSMPAVGGPALPAELSALAQRVATARGKLPLQADPALFAELSDREIAAERELAEWTRNRRRRQRRRAVSAELAAEKRDRRIALALRRADESDARWHRRARAARMRVSNSDARLAQLFRRAEWSSRALIGVVILGMVWAGVNVQHNLVPSGDMSDPLYWLSYGFEAMISIPIITIMVVATTAARWGREIERGKVVFLETALLGVTIALNAGPHLVGGEPARAAEAAVAPVMVGVVIWLHSWVSARYAQLIDDIPVDEIDSDDRPPSGYRPNHRTDRPVSWAVTDTVPSAEFHNYPQLTQMLTAAAESQYEAAQFAQFDDSVVDERNTTAAPGDIESHSVESKPAAINENSHAASAKLGEQPDFESPSATTAQVAPDPSAPVFAHTTASSDEAPLDAADSTTRDFAPPAAGHTARPTSSSSERSSRRPAQSTPLHIVSDEPHKTRTRRAVDDAVQLVLGEPIAESPHTARTSTASETSTAYPVSDLDPVATDEQPGTDTELDIPDPEVNEFDTGNIEPDAIDPAEADGGEVAIWSVAREIRKRGLSKLSVEQLAEILTLTDESWTPAAIGAAVGLPGSRILGILETARRISMPLAVGG